MSHKLTVVLFIVTMTLAGCAQYDNEAMAGAAVDIPDEKPLSEQPSVFATPSPTPAPNGQQATGQ